jgi:hypothetical protein
MEERGRIKESGEKRQAGRKERRTLVFQLIDHFGVLF